MNDMTTEAISVLNVANAVTTITTCV